MIKAIQEFFRQSCVQDATAANSPDTLHLAAAALMVELIYADEAVQGAEKTRLLAILENVWHIEKAQLNTLVKLAEEEVESAHDLYQFTRLINDNFTYDKKCQLVESLWQLAYADGHLNKYEESLIRKISDLLYVDHGDFIRLKQNVLLVR